MPYKSIRFCSMRLSSKLLLVWLRLKRFKNIDPQHNPNLLLHNTIFTLPIHLDITSQS